MTTTQPTPLISVIIPVYRAEAHLHRCIDSVLAQSMRDFELILIDDGSPDNSGAICDSYAEKDQRVRVIHQPNGGVSSARNAGLSIFRGTYAAFVDSDDYIDSDFLAQALQGITEADADLFISGLTMDTYKDDGSVANSVTYQISHTCTLSVKELLEQMHVSYPSICICGPCCKLYRGEILRNRNLAFDPTLSCGEDTDFNLSYFSAANTVVFSDRSFYHYCRSNEDSLFSRFHPDTYELHSKIYGKMYQLMLRENCSSEALQQFEQHYFSLLIGGIHEYYRFRKKTTAKEIYALIRKVAADLHISKVDTSRLSKEYKLLWLLLRCRACRTVQTYFFLRYQLRALLSCGK